VEKTDLYMQDNIKPEITDEIDLKKLFGIIWNQKIFIICVCVIGIFLGGFYALTTEKEFTSSSTFVIEKKSNQISSLSEFKALTNITGLGGSTTNSDIPIDEVMGREFIKKMDQKLNFKGDKFFYDNNPNNKDPIWKAIIKKLIGWQSPHHELNEKMWQNITEVYKKSVKLSNTNDGNAITVTVTHNDAIRSAEIANGIMQAILLNANLRSESELDERLNYLSNSLAGALGDLEGAQQKLKTFTLENSALPLETFILKTQRLDTLRLDLNRASKIHGALTRILTLIDYETTSQTDYLLLREEFPIVDQVEFRRVLGQNEVISSWNWPNKVLAMSVFNTLTERQKRLEAQVLTAQFEAKQAGQNLEKYTSLVREAKVAEATYTVLIEQVKAQSMIAGYQPDMSQIFEYAAPPLKASTPNLKNSLIIGVILGLFLGCLLALMLAFYRGVYYSHSALIKGAQSTLNIESTPLIKTRRMSFSEITHHLPQTSLATLRELALKIHNTKNTIVVFTSLNSRLKGSNVAKALASYMQSDHLKIAIIDLSLNSNQINNKTKPLYDGLFTLIGKEANICILEPNNKLKSIEFLGQRNFHTQIQSIHSDFDLIFLSADNIEAINLANVYAGKEVFHITSARIKRTKSYILTKLYKILPIQGFLYE
jgi:uncharacterized protein involved in exopolysaccharide biosynthesis